MANNETFKPGELFVYTNGERWELGMVKCGNNTGDGYFCYYHRGDTAANTPVRCMHKLENHGYTHIEQQLFSARECIDNCTGRLRDYFRLGSIVMPVGYNQALVETVAELTNCRYDEDLRFCDTKKRKK